MEILENKKKLDELLLKNRSKDAKIGLIPTMGSIHDGHLSLVRRSKKKNCFSITSIFINPTQFDNLDDFKKYPRNRESDIEKLINAKCDAVYTPLIEELYPQEVKSKKTIFEYRNILCDRFRPGHFDGVTTVVKSLIDIVKPDVAFFGEKDFQQLKIIHKIIEKYNLPVVIEDCPSIRLKNGMSLSSRYENFSQQHEKIFSQIANYIAECVQKLKKKIDLDYLINLKEKLKQYKIVTIDYLEIRDENSLLITDKNIKARLFIAFYIDKIRIIDNFILY